MLEKLVGRRYKTLYEIKIDIEILYNKKVNTIIESESEMIDGQDFMIDFEFELFDIHTLFYLKDNSGKYYITEV